MENMLLDLVYPRRCPICDKILPYGGKNICGNVHRLPYVEEPTCLKCGKELPEESDAEYCDDCRRHKRSFEKVYPAFNYVEPVKSSVLAVKYKNKREYLDFYGRMLAKRISPELKLIHLSGIVPVPVHKSKLRKRGFNQAEVLAEIIGKETGVKVYKDLLVRMSDTTPQKELSPVERANNIKQALSVGKKENDLKNVLLVDDIYTTGATVEACTEVLLAAGLKKVYVAVICVGKGR